MSLHPAKLPSLKPPVQPEAPAARNTPGGGAGFATALRAASLKPAAAPLPSPVTAPQQAIILPLVSATPQTQQASEYRLIRSL